VMFPTPSAVAATPRRVAAGLGGLPGLFFIHLKLKKINDIALIPNTLNRLIRRGDAPLGAAGLIVFWGMGAYVPISISHNKQRQTKNIPRNNSG
jgi:hypothetical protein